MVKKNKPRNWSIHSTPQFYGRAPVAPTPLLREEERINVYSDDNVTCDTISLASIDLPDGASWSDVVVSIEVNGGGYGSCDYSYEGSARADVTITYVKKKDSVNERYEEQLVQYEKDVAAYKSSKAAHKQEVKEWKQWVTDEKEKQRQEKIKKAELLIIESGGKVEW